LTLENAMPSENNNRIDPTTPSVRMSTNVSVSRQTPKTDFGDRLQSGLGTAAGALGSGLGAAAQFIPGAGIVSAAVSSAGSTVAAGTSVGGSSAHYSALATPAGASPMITTQGGGSSTGSVGGTPVYYPGTGGTPTGSGGGIDLNNLGAGAGTVAGDPRSLIQSMLNSSDPSQQMEGKMLQIQIDMQTESEMYQTVSNVIKTRGDSAKNSISNIR
jgi:hypothetical protein